VLHLLQLILLVLLPQFGYTQENKVFSTPEGDIPTMDSLFVIKTKPSKISLYLPLLQKKFGIPYGALPNPIGISIIYNYTEETYGIKNFYGEGGKKGQLSLNDITLYNLGKTFVKTHAIGAKMDIMLLPFMQIFGAFVYLNSLQVTTLHNVEVAVNIGLLSIPVPIGDMTIPTKLEGFIGMGGVNLLFAYKGFFLSFMLSGGYLHLDDKINNISLFTEKPILYYAPRIGYNHKGIFTIYFGVQGVELFGATKGKDLSKATGGLVRSYNVFLEKFPVSFLIGFQFVIIREFTITMEYIGSPDGHGVNIETGFRI